MEKLLDIIVPTWNNAAFLGPCVRSIAETGILNDIGRLLIVNNGEKGLGNLRIGMKNIEVLEPGENLGWERGLKYGLEKSDAPFVVFQNDDTQIPTANRSFYYQLLHPFGDQNVAAVGPTTTVAAGWHSIFRSDALSQSMVVPYLIFFTVAVRRAHLDEAGGIDTSCPGGDDLDLSIRLRQLGKRLIVNPGAFLVHHGFKSGNRLRGDHTVKGGWNSAEMQEETNRWLIQKHGFRVFIEMLNSSTALPPSAGQEDLEGAVVSRHVQGEHIVEMGCGFRKTVEQAVGVDRVQEGGRVPHVGDNCVADIQADVTKELPFLPLSQDTLIARHILEHCVDSVQTLRNWNRILRTGGRLIIAVPNEHLVSGIPLNPEHCHAFTPESLRNLAESAGFEQIASEDPKNGISFVSCFEKMVHMAPVKEELSLA